MASEIQGRGQVAHRFRVGRLPERAPPPAASTPPPAPCSRRRVMVGQQLGLRRDRVGEPGFQHLRNLLVVLPPRAVEQRLIRRILDQRVLEEVGGLWRQSTLVEQLRCHQLAQPPAGASRRPTGIRPAAARRKSRAPASPRVAPVLAAAR